MSLMKLAALGLLALAVLAGAGIDIVPVVASDADEVAADGLIPGFASPDPVLIRDVDPSPLAPSAIVVRRIPHVPKSR